MPNLSKSIIDLKIESRKYKFEGQFERRISIIHGDSATGKSSLTEILKIKSSDVMIKCSVKILILADDTWKSTISANTDALLIADDLRCVEQKDFADVCSKYLVENNLYLVIINRADLSEFDRDRNNGNGEHLTRLSISLNSIYSFCTDGIKHWLRNDRLPFFNDLSAIDCIITEDTKNGFEFWNNLFNNVEHSSDGRDSLVKDLEKHNPTQKILVLLDTAAYGSNYEHFKRKLCDSGYNIGICPIYECFEYVLLKSNLLKDNPIVTSELSDVHRFANKFVSWENYFEDLIDRSTYKKLYRCTHGRHAILSDCWLHSCIDCNDVKCSKCDTRDIIKSATNELNRLFKGTIFECMLELNYLSRIQKTTDKMIDPESYKGLDIFDDIK